MVNLRGTHARIAGLALSAAALAACGKSKGEQPEAAAAVKPQLAGVGCVGRIQPERGTFLISANAGGGRIPLISELRIQPGDQLYAGQVVASLSSRPALEETVREAEAQLELAKARVARVKAGAPPAEAAIVRAEIARLQQQREAAVRDMDRHRPLLEKDYIPRARMDALETHVRDIDALIAQARERLGGVATVRAEDIAIAEREVSVAEAELARARTDVQTAVVQAAAPGRVLRVIAHPGEPVGPMGIAEIANTDRMVVFAEVYEADIARVREGSKATVTSELLPHPLTGRVSWISPAIEHQEPLSVEPGAPSDARVFKVKIELPDQSVLAQRINGKVDVVIEP